MAKVRRIQEYSMQKKFQASKTPRKKNRIKQKENKQKYPLLIAPTKITSKYRKKISLLQLLQRSTTQIVSN